MPWWSMLYFIVLDTALFNVFPPILHHSPLTQQLDLHDDLNVNLEPKVGDY